MRTEVIRRNPIVVRDRVGAPPREARGALMQRKGKTVYEQLKTPFTIGRVRLPNRVVMPAMGTNLSACGGGVSDDIIAYYEARARGGVGLIITEITRIVDGAGVGEPCQLAARSFRDVPELQRLVDAVHKYDTKLFIQLQHPGREATPLIAGEQPVAPSPLPGTSGVVPRELKTEECESLVEAFVSGAVIARMAGADGVELHAAHGYLINEFMSPAMNMRTDKYGGNFENRMRFVTEIIEGIRAQCGNGFPLAVRFNAEEALPGGIDISLAQEIARELERLGVDLLDISCYSSACIEPGTYAQGWKRNMVSAISDVVDVPVLAVCHIKQPDQAEKLLEEKVCDLVGVARGHLADAEWCNKAFEGRADEIRNCIGCLACFGEISALRRIKCAVNPVTGREREYAMSRRDGKQEKIAVIGGGPAGIEAALVLKERGFEPHIFDEGKRLGGTLNTADKGYGKTLITAYVDALITQVERAGIAVHQGRASAETIRDFDPVGVFIACGALPWAPSIRGIDGAKVCTAEDVLLEKADPSGKVAVIGSGMTGLETAEVLADRGCDLSLVEMCPSVGGGIYPSVVEDVMGRITPSGAQVLTSCRLTQVTDTDITVHDEATEQERELPVDWVVLAMGVRPRQDVVDEFKQAFPHAQVVGDAHRCGRILEATQDAHGKAFVYKPTK